MNVNTDVKLNSHHCQTAACEIQNETDGDATKSRIPLR